MATESVHRNRYRVFFYKGDSIEYQLAAFGIDSRDAMEAAKTFLRDVKKVDWAKYLCVVEPTPLDTRLDKIGAGEVYDLLR
ncbi:hypothetical protein [Comamonas terrigena]|uniref:hypothetical protein n=1 Tax=Comamonas terrigena TaxID=32013 RepID=UPI00235592C4|nr:hypothetical protein [Comamonas terrigena]